MSNIKTIMTIKPVYGLKEEMVLTRENPNEDFKYESEYAGKDHRQSMKFSVSESMIDKEHFSAIEWFSEKPLTNKQKIAKLEEELAAEKEKSASLESILSSTKSYIGERIDMYEGKYKDLINKLDSFIPSERDLVEADLSLSVYRNIVRELSLLK